MNYRDQLNHHHPRKSDELPWSVLFLLLAGVVAMVLAVFWLIGAFDKQLVDPFYSTPSAPAAATKM